MYVTEVLKDDPKLTSALIAQNLNISTKTVMRIFKSLKEKHVITRVGGDRGGYWRVLI